MHVVDDAPNAPLRAGDPTNRDAGRVVETFAMLDDVEVSRRVEKLYAVRSDVNRFLTPAFLCTPDTDETRCLSDGCVSGIAEAYVRADVIERRVASFSGCEPPLDESERLLRFLATRPGFELRPIRDWKDPHSYRYPLLDALREFEMDSRTWLVALQKRQFIEPAGDVIDRVRHCRACASTHLNYVDLCPACSSLQITTAPFLHCFGCGYVAEERSFEGLGGRSCPKCSRILRHIGIDYDRALQNFSCSDCNVSFSDPKIAARCLNCSRECDPANLNVRDVRTWKLSRAGRSAARLGARLTKADSSLRSIVSDRQFADLVAWAQRTRQRYKEVQFGLLCVRVTAGEPKLEAELDLEFSNAFRQRVRETVRGSEVVGEGSDESILIFCPHSNPASLASVRQRIAALGGATDANRAGPVKIHVNTIHSNDIPAGEHPEDVLDYVFRQQT